MTHHIDLDALQLASGGHPNPEAGMCVMEAVAYFAHEPHSDHPACVSPVIGAFLRRWNDDLDDEGRQRLKPLIPLVVGTRASKEVEDRRAWMATDWMVRTHLPAWLDLGGMSEQATAVRSLDPIISPDSWSQGRPTVDGARRAAAAAGAAAWDAARDAAGAAARNAAGAAAWDAARDAARAAAWDAAGAAARNAAGAAAWDAARDAARDAAWDAAGDAARDAAWAAARDAAGAAAWDAAWAAARAAARDAARDAAWAAARDAARDAAGAAARDAAGAAAWDAAWAAAGDALRPTAEGLQASALDLVERMCAVGAEVPA